VYVCIKIVDYGIQKLRIACVIEDEKVCVVVWVCGCVGGCVGGWCEGVSVCVGCVYGCDFLCMCVRNSDLLCSRRRKGVYVYVCGCVCGCVYVFDFLCVCVQKYRITCVVEDEKVCVCVFVGVCIWVIFFCMCVKNSHLLRCRRRKNAYRISFLADEGYCNKEICSV